MVQREPTYKGRGGEGERRGREGDAPLMQIPGFAFGM